MLTSTYNVIKSFERRLRRRLQGNIHDGLPPDVDPQFISIYDTCKPYTMTSPMRMYTLYEAVKYVQTANIEGDIVECGVWHGGSAMIAAMTLSANGKSDRGIWLYDTYEGMSQPSEKDVNVNGRRALDRWENTQLTGKNDEWCFASLNDVRRNLQLTGYPSDRLHFAKGKVEQTIPEQSPGQIAVLRLDTDWYESTYHELKHLYPRLSIGGVLILDDYGQWKGARDATDQYFRETGRPPLLCRIDKVARIAVKVL